MKFSRFKRDYLLFSKKERNAAVALLLFISFSLLLPAIENKFTADPEPGDYSLMKTQFKLIQNKQVSEDEMIQKPDGYLKDDFQYTGKVENRDQEPERTLFYFDPNKLSKAEWMQLGISEVIAGRIINYLGKGGSFRQKNDLLKIYGFSETDFNAIESYIRIESTSAKTWDDDAADEILIPSEMQMTEINSAGLGELTRLGFNKDLSNRIINFKNGLGGIYSIEQLNNVFGMKPELLEAAKPFITIDVNLLQTIPLNSCSFEQLAKHSYISDELAQALIDYRTITGRFVSVTEVLKVNGMYPRLFEKLKPYLTL